VSVPVIDPPEDAESIRERRREVCWRLGISGLALLIGLLLAAMPIPYVTDGSITQTVITVFSLPSMPHLLWIVQGISFAEYLLVACQVALGLTLPTYLFHGFALVGPCELAARKRGRSSAALALYALFILGVATWGFWWLPVLVELQRFSSESFPALVVTQRDDGKVLFETGLAFLIGMSFQLPLWPSVLLRLRIASRRSLERSRRYVLLSVVAVAALVTPTSDILTMAIVALPLYLLYELGLWGAHLVPEASAESDSPSN
jgi:sec-independent protein translocase protein TatC